VRGLSGTHDATPLSNKVSALGASNAGMFLVRNAYVSM